MSRSTNISESIALDESVVYSFQLHGGICKEGVITSLEHLVSYRSSLVHVAGLVPQAVTGALQFYSASICCHINT